MTEEQREKLVDFVGLPDLMVLLIAEASARIATQAQTEGSEC